MRTKYFITPFGVSGTITPAVPDATDPSGFVSYNQGFTFDYQRDLTSDPLAKSPTYVNFNNVLNSITSSLQALQQEGVPEFITSSDNGGSAFSYGLGALVLWSAGGTPPFNLYLSLVNANTALPSVTANWLDLTTFHSFSYGPLSANNTWTGVNTHANSVVLNNSVWLQGKDSGGTARNMLLYGADNFVHLVGGTAGTTIQNAALTANNVLIDDSGNVTVRGSFGAGSSISVPNNVSFTSKDTGGTARSLIVYTSGNAVLLTGGQNGFYINNNASSANNLVLDDSGNLSIRAAGSFGGTVAIANATATNHAVALGQFPSNLGSPGWKKYADPNSPTGYVIEQWGALNAPDNTTTVDSFPLAFPNTVLMFVCSLSASIGSSTFAIGGQAISNSQFEITNTNPGASNLGIQWIAKGY